MIEFLRGFGSMKRLSTVVLALGLLACPKAPVEPAKGPPAAPKPATKPAEAPAKALRWAVVLVEGNDVLNLRAEPRADASLIEALKPSTRGLVGGKTETVGRAVWREVSHGAKTGWVNAAYLTQDVPNAEFAADPAIAGLLEAFAKVIKGRGDLRPLVSARGLYVAHYDAAKWHKPAAVATLLTDLTVLSWNGPACGEGCINGTFADVVGEVFLDGYRDADRELKPQWWKRDGNAAALAPARLAGFRAMTVYDPGDVEDVPDWHSTTVYFEYAGGHPLIVGLAHNAWSP